MFQAVKSIFFVVILANAICACNDVDFESRRTSPSQEVAKSPMSSSDVVLPAASLRFQSCAFGDIEGKTMLVIAAADKDMESEEATKQLQILVETNSVPSSGASIKLTQNPSVNLTYSETTHGDVTKHFSSGAERTCELTIQNSQISNAALSLRGKVRCASLQDQMGGSQELKAFEFPIACSGVVQ